jgi:hypothetical protein
VVIYLGVDREEPTGNRVEINTMPTWGFLSRETTCELQVVEVNEPPQRVMVPQTAQMQLFRHSELW